VNTYDEQGEQPTLDAALDLISEYAQALCNADGERMRLCRADSYMLDFVHQDATGAEPLGELETRGFWETWFKGFPDMDFQITRTIAATGVVVTQWTFTGVNSGPIEKPIAARSIQPTGKTIRFRGVTIFELSAGGIQRETMYIDFATFWAELGVTP
jgi:steroid delta-isomerase-like uncharacterized protein